MLLHDQGPTLIDSGEFKAEGFAFRGLPAAWDDEDEDDDEDEKETSMMQAPVERSSLRSLRVLPAVPTLWTPPPPPSAPVLPPINPPAFRTAASRAPHWVPEPPPPRISVPSAPAWAQWPPPPPFLSPELEPEPELSSVGPHVAITLATPRTQARRQRILRRVILPWPAAVMIAAVAGGVIFEHAERGDTWSAIASTVDSAQRLVRH